MSSALWAGILAGVASTSPAPSSTGPDSVAAQLGPGELVWIIAGILFIAAIVVATPIILGAKIPHFYNIPFVTWFMLHFGIGALAILALLALALAGSLTAPLVAIFSGLFGFIFGSSAARMAQGTSNTTKPLAVSRVEPSRRQLGHSSLLSGKASSHRQGSRWAMPH